MTKGQSLDFHELNRALSAGDIDRTQFLNQLRHWKPERLAFLLTQWGFAETDLPCDDITRAQLVLAVIAPERLDSERSAGPATTAGMLANQVFDSDPESLIMRFSRPAGDKGDRVVMAVHRQAEGTLAIRQDLLLCASQLPEHYEPPSPGEEYKPTLPCEEIPVAPGEPIAQSRYLHTNIKLVFWIPYFPNELPMLNRILPFWKGQMGHTERKAMAALLASGNPPPPEAFPTPASYAQFVATKEYRGVINIDLLACGETGRIGGALVSADQSIVGFTPPFSAISLAPNDTFGERLRNEHKARESLASEIVGAVKDGGLLFRQLQMLTGITQLGIDDQIDDAIPPLIELAKKSPLDAKTQQSYTPGNLAPGTVQSGLEGNCFNGFYKMGIQVNDIENILFAILTGRLLPYMWGQLQFKLCSDGTLDVFVKGSSIPNKTLYINNRRVGSYDMTAVNFDTIKVSVPFAGDKATAAQLSNPSKIDPKFAKAPEGIQVSAKQRLRSESGCPTTIPDQWRYDEQGV